MQFLSQLRSTKRSWAESAPKGVSPGPLGAPARGLISANTGADDKSTEDGSCGTSSSKRRRAAAAPQPACQAFFDNPLFEDESTEWEYMSSGGGTSGWGDENEHAAGSTGDSPSQQDAFADFCCTPPDTSGGGQQLLQGFMRGLCSTPALSALTMLERRDMHCVGGGTFACLQVTIAGLLVLARRASLRPDEFTPEMMLTLLWLQQSTNSQYSASLAWVLDLFLRLHPDYRSLRDCAATRASIVELQLAVLQRSSWRVVLLDDTDLRACLQDLQSLGDQWAELVHYVQHCAHGGSTPFGTHGHSPEAAAAVDSLLQQQQQQQQQRQAPGSGSRASTETGLDGAYWRRTGSERTAVSRVLRPRNQG